VICSPFPFLELPAHDPARTDIDPNSTLALTQISSR